MIISESVKYVALLHIIVAYVKGNIITKLQKLCRNLKAGNKSPVLYLEKPLCTDNLSPACKIFIATPGRSYCDCKRLHKKAERQLNNTGNYRNLLEDPTATNMILANDTTKRFKKQKLVNEKVFWGQKRNDSKTPELYLRRKIHKEGNVSRPVVSSVNYHITNNPKYID